MQEYPCGYDKNNLAVVDIGGNCRDKADWLRERLRSLPEVEDVAYAMDIVGGADAYSTDGADFGKGPVMMSMIYCSWNLPQVLGLEVMEGRGFRENDFGPILFTQDLKEYGVEARVYPDINIVSGGKLASSGTVQTTNGITNNSVDGLELTDGATLTSNVTGDGNVKTSGNVQITDGSTISQGVNVAIT